MKDKGGIEMSENVSPLGVVGGPTQEQINEWKAKHTDVFVAKFSDEEKYVYRPLKRFEYKQILGLGQQENKSFAEEKVAQFCILWPTIDPAKLATFKAGTISTLVDLIMAASNFGIQEEPVKL
jgi:hypothetical protein